VATTENVILLGWVERRAQRLLWLC